MKSFFQELQDRKVTRTAIGYSVVAFIIMQLVEILFPIFEFPNWTSKFVIILLFLGFPIVIVVSWIFDVKNDGIKKSPKSNYLYFLIILAILSTYLLFIGYGYLFSQENDKAKASNHIDVNSIAVLPFDNYSKDKNDEYFSDGFTELIIANLAKINDLTVISRTSVMQYKNTTKSLKEIGKELGVANILDVVLIISFILDGASMYQNEEIAMQVYLGDMNQDNGVDVLDIVMLVEKILN